MEVSRDAEPQPQPESPGTAAAVAEAAEEQQEEDENDALVKKVTDLMEKITANAENPNPNVLHALSTVLETEESRYMEDADPSAINNGRSTHIVGRLGQLIQGNDEFFELISRKFLTESRYSESVQAASARLLFSCSLTWTFPHAFEDDVLDKLRSWLVDESPRSSRDDRISKHETEKLKTSDSEMLCTYSTGLLAVCLTFGGKLVEDVLASGLPAKLIRYLRIRVLGETSTNQRDSNPLIETKTAPTMVCPKTREDVRGRLRQVTEGSHSDVDVMRIHSSRRDRERDPSSLDGVDRCFSRQTCGDWDGEKSPDSMALDLGANETEMECEEKYSIRDLRGSKTKPSGKSHREEDTDENVRDDSSRRRTNRGISKSGGKGRAGEGISENEQTLISPGSVTGAGYLKDRTSSRTQDLTRTPGGNKGLDGNNADYFIIERDDNDDCFQDCKVGSKDITDLVKRAVRAAEDQARTVNAPAIAIKAAGDDAAETVKAKALEEYKRTHDEEAAVLAASITASAFIDAPSAVALLRSSNSVDGDSENSNLIEPEIDEVIGEYSILDNDSLAKLRERFCIQCLVLLGEYVEVLGPVLHEKGVDVCLALLQRSVKHKEESGTVSLLPDILKLICALAAHRKFAALFVDRGGMQRLLSVPKNTYTFFPLSACLFTIGSIQGIMERVCALPPIVVQDVVKLALQLFECPRDHQARKNAALFFAAAFVFRAVIDAFDAQDGLQKLLSLLHDASSVRSGVPRGSSDRSPPDVLTSLEKQVAFHTCVALRQYFRAHTLLLVDSIRPTKNVRNAPRNTSSVRAAYKPLDISNEAMDTVFRQIQKDRKLGPALVRARWPVIDHFLNSSGHITMLELCQGPPVERYLHESLQYALDVLHIVTLVPYSRMCIVNASLSNDRVGIAVILDAAYVDKREIVEPALNLLINLVCPPPSISNKLSVESRGDRNNERNIAERAVTIPSQNEPASLDRGGSSLVATPSIGNTPSQSPLVSGLVGDRRISLGAGAGCAGLAAQLEQGYRQAREAVRTYNGIKVLLRLLQPRMLTSPASPADLDCIRALTCRVLLGLARDDAIAHILTKLQVGKKLSRLIRDSGSQTPGGEQNRWQTELSQVTVELIGVVTNSGRASTLAASDAATPTLKRIERAAIAAATPITYHSRELLLLMHDHLQSSGLTDSAATLLKEARLTHQATGPEPSSLQIQWPSGRAPCRFLLDNPKVSEDSDLKCDSAILSSKQKVSASSAARNHHKVLPTLEDSPVPSNTKSNISSQKANASDILATPSVSSFKSGDDTDIQTRPPIVLPMKRKSTDVKEIGSTPSAKRLNTSEHSPWTPNFMTPHTVHRSGLPLDPKLFSTPIYTPNDRSVPNVLSADLDDYQSISSLQHGVLKDSQPCGTERTILDNVVVQYLKHQHRQCPTPITTLPPLSISHPHVCSEPRRSLDAPSNVTARLSSREFRSMYGSIHGNRKDRQFVYSRFRPWRTCRDDSSSLLTCISFLGDSSRIACGSHSGELKVFDSNSNTVLESHTCHQSPVTLLQSHFSGDTQLLLSSSANDVRLWDTNSVSGGPMHSFEEIKTARFSNSGTIFAALRSDSSQREILLYDTNTCQLDLTLTGTPNSLSGQDHLAYSLVHFSPSDSILLWDGVLWDRRGSGPIHRFDDFTNYGGGGFHPAGNEVIINSEVWDLRKFRLLQKVPSLDQTVITFNASGDVIYAILRRNLEDVMSAFNNSRAKHPLFSAFRTVDAVNYTDIATIPVDRCVLDFATEPTDSFVGLITMDDEDEMYSSGRVYEIGRRKPTDDDSDPDDAESDEDEEDDDSDLEHDLDLDGDSDDDDDDDIESNDDDDVEADLDFLMGGDDSDGGGIMEILSDGDEDDDDEGEMLEYYSTGDEAD